MPTKNTAKTPTADDWLSEAEFLEQYGHLLGSDDPAKQAKSLVRYRNYRTRFGFAEYFSYVGRGVYVRRDFITALMQRGTTVRTPLKTRGAAHAK